MAPLVERYLPNTGSFVFYGITWLIGLIYVLALFNTLKKTRVRQVVIDEWLPLDTLETWKASRLDAS